MKFCVDCGKEITYCSVRCVRCAKIGENHPRWKGGFWKDKEYKAVKLCEWRHKKGVSKKYNSQTTGMKYTKKQANQMYKRRVRVGGKLPIERIQQVYEDNIKKYGTLTCYLCLEAIKFGKDSIDHKVPLSRGGSNEYGNLAIACRKCNCKKHTKTEEEYRKKEEIIL